MRTVRPVFTVSAIVFLLPLAAGEPAEKGVDIPPYQPPPGYVCHRASGQIKIDGRLNDAAWRDAPWTENFVDIRGEKEAKPRHRTRVKMLYDDEYLYIGAELQDPHVWATLTEHDSVIFHDNDFEIFIDPDGDNHNYYELEINAHNATADIFLPRPYKDGGRALKNWDIQGLKSAVYVDGTLNNPSDRDEGWYVEVALPWKVLGEQANVPAPPRDGDQWRINFCRVQWEHEIVSGKYQKAKDKPESSWVWSPQGVNDMHRPEKWGYVQFSTGRIGDVQFDPDPAGPAKHLLHVIYYAQREFRKEHQRYAKSLEELDLEDLKDESLAGGFRIETTESSYEASVEVRVGPDKTERWHIRQDALIWSNR